MLLLPIFLNSSSPMLKQCPCPHPPHPKVYPFVVIGEMYPLVTSSVYLRTKDDIFIYNKKCMDFLLLLSLTSVLH